jgi:L-ascorbate metabolism protein UlaG (beta-lactamase superfamily)
MPESLRGLVELLYDLNNNPQLRFYEDLVYDNGLMPEQMYEIALSRTPEKSRPFFLSTPRLADAEHLHVPMCFDDARIDALAAMRLQAAPLGEAARMLNIDSNRMESLRQFFTTEAPQRNAPMYAGEGVRVRYFGHACVLVQTAATSILLDPMLAWEAKGDGRFTFDDLPDRIDYAVISHGHQDHCSPEMLLQLRHRIGRVLVPSSNDGSLSDPSIKLLLKRLGIGNVTALRAFDEVAVPGGKIMSWPSPGEHVDLDIYSRHAVFIELEGRKLAFLVDTDGCEPQLFRRVAARTGRDLDGLFFGMECHGAPLTWLYGPLLTQSISRRDDESRRLSGLDCHRAWHVLQEFSPKKVFVYAMGQEPWLRYIMGLEYTPDSIQIKELVAFLGRCRAAGLDAENLFMSREILF